MLLSRIDVFLCLSLSKNQQTCLQVRTKTKWTQVERPSLILLYLCLLLCVCTEGGTTSVYVGTLAGTPSALQQGEDWRERPSMCWSRVARLGNP